MCCLSPNEASLFSASCSLDYFGPLRISEVPCIKISDLQFDSAGHLNLKISKSKTDKADYSLKKNTKQPPTHFCPAKQVSKYIKYRSEYSGPLLIHINNTPITRFEFHSFLHRALDFFQVTGYYASNTFCIGMATQLAKQEVSVFQIETMGRWMSDWYLIYIRPGSSVFMVTSRHNKSNQFFVSVLIFLIFLQAAASPFSRTVQFKVSLLNNKFLSNFKQDLWVFPSGQLDHLSLTGQGYKPDTTLGVIINQPASKNHLERHMETAVAPI